MLTIVIADDEVGIIDLCKMLIEYPNASVIGEAHNGLELFDKIGELRPNTVITDLSMPGMTGLELIEEAQSAYPEVNFIVMSGYTDFEYVQKALRFGVWDYLLKPLQKAELNRVLKKLDEHLMDAQSEAVRQEAVQCDLEESMQALRQRYLRDIWQSGRFLPVPRIGEKPVLEPAGNRMQCLLFCVDSLFAVRGVDAASVRKKAESVITQALELMRQSCAEVCAFLEENELAALLLYAADGAEETGERLLREVNGLMRSFNSQNSFVRVSCAASELDPGEAERLPRLFEQAKAAVKWRFERKDETVIRYAPETALALQQERPFTQGSALREAIAAADAEQVAALLLADWKRLENPVPGSGYLLLEEQLRCLNGALRQLPGVENLPKAPHIDLAEVLSGGVSPEQLSGRLADCARSVLTAYQEYFASRENSMVAQAKQYVAQHFAEDISLNQIARYVCLSPAYFSTLFKAETGCGFVKYLQHVRIEHAKKLLKSSKMRISDIALAVGYRDLKFFNKIFQNETTVTPSEYRKFYS